MTEMITEMDTITNEKVRHHSTGDDCGNKINLKNTVAIESN